MHTYILVIVDVCTRFVFLRPLPNKCAESVGSALFKVFCDIGFPKIIQSDNGKEFVNKLTQAICKESHIDHRLITPYHPRANGLAERNVKIAKESIYKLINGREQDWSFYVPQTQYFMNTRIASYHDSTPYSLMYGRAHNEFSNYGQVDMSTASEPELRARLEFLTSVVYPSINTKSATFAEKMNAPADVRLTTTIPNGAYDPVLPNIPTKLRILTLSIFASCKKEAHFRTSHHHGKVLPKGLGWGAKVEGENGGKLLGQRRCAGRGRAPWETTTLH
jgi:hypothetical protein